MESEMTNGVNGDAGGAQDTPSTPNVAASNGSPDQAPTDSATTFSWLDPHPIFVIVLVGKDEQPFGIQKDFLCAKSSFYRHYFATNKDSESIEHLVKLPDASVEIFAYAQNFIYTGNVFVDDRSMPSYDVLVGVWKLGDELGIHGLCDRTLEAMDECRRLTQSIPATPLLVQVWKDTPEGSSIRKLLVSWAAEYMRSSDSRKEFAKSLPQEVLSELVVAMSSLDAAPTGQAKAASPFSSGQRKNVHYVDADDDGELGAPAKRQRHSDVLPDGHAPATRVVLKKAARTSLPSTKPAVKRKPSTALPGGYQPSMAQKLNFCADLLTRMLSGPGFWTRLVGPFKDPVSPITDNVPDYFEKIKNPMDLGTMKLKMDTKKYTSDEEFLGDMRLIFTNCYTYWTRKHPVWHACEKLEKTFEEKYSQMYKWIAKMDGEEAG